MKALISPNENNRIAQVADAEFEVAQPLFWTDCPDDCVADLWFYNTANDTCEPKPIEPTPPVEEGAE